MDYVVAAIEYLEGKGLNAHDNTALIVLSSRQKRNGSRVQIQGNF